MSESRNRRDPKPLTGGERATLLVFALLLFGGFAAELLRDFHPVKLSALFVVIWWVPLLALHEASHAIVARALGWGVRRVVVGFGRPLWRRRWAGVDVEVRLAPVMGFTLAYPRQPEWGRLKELAVYLAGPASAALVLGVLVGIVGLDTLLTRSNAVGWILLQSLAVAAAVELVVNLVPMMTPDAGDPTGSRFAPNDGMGVILVWRRDRLYYRQQAALWRQVEAGALREPEEE